MKKSALFCALALLVFVVMPAYAEVQNVKVSGDLNTYIGYRKEFDFSDAGADDDDQDWFNTTTRVRVDADLTDNVSTTVRLLNERDWDDEAEGITSSGDTGVVIDLASISLKEFLYSPLTLTLGRQELRYGNALVVGDVDNNSQSAETGLVAREFSVRKAFDAVRSVLDFDPITIDSFYAKLDETGTVSRDIDLWGVDVDYAVGSYNANVAAYVVGYQDLGVAETASSIAQIQPQRGGSFRGETLYTFGIRGNVEPTESLTVGGELAFETGDFTPNRDQSANAFQFNGQYTFNTTFKPAVKLQYAFFSGEEVGNAGDQESWIPLAEDQTWGIIADRMNLSTVSGGTPQNSNTNMHIVNLGASFVPLEDLTVTADWYYFQLVEENDTSAAAGVGATDNTGVYTDDEEYGNEFDFTATYDYTEDVALNSAIAVFSPGDAWEPDARDTAIQVTGGVSVAF
ncbi:MAG: alginate export family protein [Candidatus Omnitrophica bacterium]|nr:alginate export family protein [Candidatus Omnitrophota bacterium]